MYDVKSLLLIYYVPGLDSKRSEKCSWVGPGDLSCSTGAYNCTSGKRF